MSQPNILLITTDQQRFDHLGCKGMDAIATHNLDRLAGEGVHFDRAYCSAPVCTPARVSLLTGRYPSSHGAYTIGVTADPLPRPTIAEILADAGYATAIFGKTHFVRRADEAGHVAGIKDPSPEYFRTFKGPYLGFQEVQVSTGHTIHTWPDMHYRVFLEDAGVDYKQWFPHYHPDYDHDRCGSWEIPVEFHDTTWVGGLTEQYIRRRATGQPWFCWASFQDPHEPFVCPEPWYSRVDRSKLKVFEGPRPGEFDDRPAFYKKAAGGDWEDLNDGHGVPCCYHLPKRDERAMNALQATLGMIGFIDDRVGGMLRALEQTGQLNNTVVIFTTDHGELHGHHGFWGKGLPAYEDGQRIPLLIWGPGYVWARGTLDALVNLVDLPRTMLSLAGLETPIGMQGFDLTPILRGQADRVADFTFVECQATRKIYQQTLVTDRYKLVVYRDSDEGELYDLQNDPDQYVNLWNKPAHQSIKNLLFHRFIQARMQIEGRVNPRQAFA